MIHTCVGGRNFTIDETRFIAGCHRLDITIIGPDVYGGGPKASIPKSYQFNIRRKLFIPGRGTRKAL